MQMFFYSLVLLTISLAAGFPREYDNELEVITEEEAEKAMLAMYDPNLFGGDIGENPFDPDRNAVPGEKKRWPGAKVPYVIDPAMEYFRNAMNLAIKDYHENTCIRFVPRTDEEDYIKIVPHTENKCQSEFVGRNGGPQRILFSSGCNFKGLVVHELAHALGLWHEQNRSDRDEYLDIFLENVKPGYEFNFKKLAPHENILYTDFDPDSIMMYSSKQFSKNDLDTMRMKDGRALLDPIWKEKLSKSDAERLNKMYNCKV